MSHTGTWRGRMRMAWATWGLGAAGFVFGGVGLFLGKDTGTLVGSGVSMITGVVALVVAGKVWHDKQGGPKE